MAYTSKNFKTRKALVEAIKAGEEIGVFTPGGMFPNPTDGIVSLEGPWYPEPHRWYARAEVRDELIVKVLK